MQLLADGTTDCVHVLALKMTEMENLGHLQEKKIYKVIWSTFMNYPHLQYHKDVKFQRVQKPKG